MSESDDSAGSVEESCSQSEVEDDIDVVNKEEWTSSAEAKSNCTDDDAVDLEANAEAALEKLLPCSLEEFGKVCFLKYQLSDRRYYTASLLCKLEEWLGVNQECIFCAMLA